ncbi:hypothetical protein ACN42_g9582, partial [Penicillium freii]
MEKKKKKKKTIKQKNRGNSH